MLLRVEAYYVNFYKMTHVILFQNIYLGLGEVTVHIAILISWSLSSTR